MLVFILIMIGGDSLLGASYHLTVSSVLTALILGLLVGAAEEFVFLGLLISFLKKYFTLTALQIALWSGVIFGAVHVVNVSSSGNLLNTVAQILGAFGIGFLLAAIYLITNNLWMIMIGHGLIDALDQIAFSSLSNAVGTSIFTGVLYFVAYLLIGIWLLNKYQPRLR